MNILITSGGTLGHIKQIDEDLSKHTSIKIGGRARYFVEPKSIDELLLFLNKKIKCFILGNGTNTLINNFDGAVISLKKVNKIKIIKNKVICEAGANLNDVINKCAENGLSGIERLYGIPGTIGAAVKMNAGATGCEIGNCVNYVNIIKNKKIKKLKNITFNYRNSDIDGIIVSVELKLDKKNKKLIKNNIKKIKEKRKTEPKEPSLGSVFKNPKGKKAWRLIDSCGLRGYSVGDAQISKKHCNWIVNKGNASFDDVIELIKIIKSKVYKKFKIKLEEEIDIVQ